MCSAKLPISNFDDHSTKNVIKLIAVKYKYSCYMDSIENANNNNYLQCKNMITMYDEMDWMKYALNSFI